MKKKTLFVALAMAVALQANAQRKGGGISSELQNKIQKEQKLTAADNAVANAIAANAIDNLAKNRKAAAELHAFQHRDPKAKHHRPEEFGTLLDVQRNERTARQLRQAH